MAEFQEMIGRKYLYMGNEHLVKSIGENGDGKFHVMTNRTTIKLTKGEIRKDMLPVEVEVSTDGALSRYYKDETIQISSLADVLMQEIKNIQNDSGRIEQARAISDTARTLIELKKTQIEMLKLMKDVR